ncbi:TetR/AcrR family transcriptional regulator [Streptacidiphilus sp. MAP5-3]|uniref:TetR/AcrR family transcriptional regulator n=1 Tax=unclassified Streptacidiphilus TaxID=2643834 RepID=UPI00351131B0
MARAGLNAERVTRAAADLADQVGLEKVTVSAVARGFGVKDASLYAHLSSLAELRERIAGLAMAELADALGDAVAGRSGRAALTAFADAYRDFALAHPGRYAATQLNIECEGGHRVVAACAALLRGYRLEDVDAVDAVRLLCSSFHGWVTLEAADRFRSDRPMAESWQVALTALDGALRTWGGRAGVPRASV